LVTIGGWAVVVACLYGLAFIARHLVCTHSSSCGAAVTGAADPVFD
jgi:hypothetical protein